MDKENSPLKRQVDYKATVVIKIDEADLILEDCLIFANDSKENDIVFLAQDPKIPERKIQVTISKSQ